ncbi:MAG: hypothetical protein ACI9TI_002506, partial [Natronomonas sp.]
MNASLFPSTISKRYSVTEYRRYPPTAAKSYSSAASKHAVATGSVHTGQPFERIAAR